MSLASYQLLYSAMSPFLQCVWATAELHPLGYFVHLDRIVVVQSLRGEPVPRAIQACKLCKTCINLSMFKIFCTYILTHFTCFVKYFLIWGDGWDLNSRQPEPQSGALTNWATVTASRISYILILTRTTCFVKFYVKKCKLCMRVGFEPTTSRTLPSALVFCATACTC